MFDYLCYAYCENDYRNKRIIGWFLDCYQIPIDNYQFLIRFATMELVKVTYATTETELKGIKIAATIGESIPETAKYIPITLYRNDKTKLDFTTLIAEPDSFRRFVSLLNLFASNIASQAGEKW